MAPTDKFRAKIPPVAPGIRRPKISVMIPTFNCARFLPVALSSVLDQGFAADQMQIEVIDDFSVDDPERVVHSIGHGRVSFFRQRRNVGHIENFRTCLERACGHYVHLLHGDDCIRPGFYDRLLKRFVNPGVGAAFCRSTYIDSHGDVMSVSAAPWQTGILPNAAASIAAEQRIMTPSIVVRREVYETLRGFDARLKCSEDWEMWVRIAANYSVWFEDAPLAMYRMHDSSNTARHIRTASDMAYTRAAIMMFKSYLPRDCARTVIRGALSVYANTALDNAERMLNRGDHRACFAQLVAAVRFSCAAPVLARTTKLVFKACKRRGG